VSVATLFRSKKRISNLLLSPTWPSLPVAKSTIYAVSVSGANWYAAPASFNSNLSFNLKQYQDATH
jgi:hypothetical protein